LSIQALSDANLFTRCGRTTTIASFRVIPAPTRRTTSSYGAEFIFDMRLENRIGTDDHCIYRPDRARWERVRKLNSRSYFKEDAARKTYGSLARSRPGVLEGAVETTRSAPGGSIAVQALPMPFARILIYQLWETVVNWLDRIGGSLDDCIPELRDIHPVLTLDVSEIEQIGDFSERQ
jgi:hypothetical protein